MTKELEEKIARLQAIHDNSFIGYYRCYDGCPDTALSAKQEIDSLLFQDAFEEVLKHEPEAHATYFPMEDKYQVHVWGKPLSGMFDTRLLALKDALVNFSTFNKKI